MTRLEKDLVGTNRIEMGWGVRWRRGGGGGGWRFGAEGQGVGGGGGGGYSSILCDGAAGSEHKGRNFNRLDVWVEIYPDQFVLVSSVFEVPKPAHPSK